MSSDSEKHSSSDDDIISEDYITPVNQPSNKYGSRIVTFLSEKQNQLCKRFSLINQKVSRNDTKRFDDEIVAIFDKLLEYTCINPIQNKKLFKIIPLERFRLANKHTVHRQNNHDVL